MANLIMSPKGMSLLHASLLYLGAIALLLCVMIWPYQSLQLAVLGISYAFLGVFLFRMKATWVHLVVKYSIKVFCGLSIFATCLSFLSALLAYLKMGVWKYADNIMAIKNLAEFGEWLNSEPSDWIGAHKIAVWYFANIPVSLLSLAFWLIVSVAYKRHCARCSPS